jgi:hypothetical protein
MDRQQRGHIAGKASPEAASVRALVIALVPELRS